MGGGWDVGKSLQQVVGGTLDPLNISGYGGIPGVNSNGRTLGDLGNDVTGKTNMDRAMDAQKGATGNANAVLKDTYAQQQGYLQPTYDTGQSALQQLAGGNLMDNYKTSDAYKFNLAEGQNAINNNMAARGLGNSGAALKELTKYQTGLLSQDQQQHYNNEFNRLNALAGYGNNAANNMASAAGAYGSNLSNNIMGLGNATAAANIAQANNNTALLQQGLGLGAAALFSDERLKTNIVAIDPKDIKEFRENLSPYLFKYINEEHGDGLWAGVMAQDLEKSKLGRLIVFEDKDGNKQINTKKAISLLLALQAEVA